MRALSLVVILWSSFATHTAVAATDPNLACRLPFEKITDPKSGDVFPLSAVQNEAGISRTLQLRYIVGDFNSTDANGHCRGIQELISKVDTLSDFGKLRQLALLVKVSVTSYAGKRLEEVSEAIGSLSDANARQKALAILTTDDQEIRIELEDLQNYQSQVARYATKPVTKQAVQNGYCIGENLNYCEIRNPKFDSSGHLIGGDPTLVYKFVTSTSRDLPPPSSYYAPINYINTRHWSSDRKYTSEDSDRDARLGGGLSTLAMFRNGGSPEEMPNFMNFRPLPGYLGETQNGIHEIAGGLDSGGRFGAPVSLGCVRLNKYQAKLSRWWTPQGARFFIYLDPDRYFQKADSEGNGVRPRDQMARDAN